jgi:hypothetical protein
MCIVGTNVCSIRDPPHKVYHTYCVRLVRILAYRLCTLLTDTWVLYSAIGKRGSVDVQLSGVWVTVGGGVIRWRCVRPERLHTCTHSGARPCVYTHTRFVHADTHIDTQHTHTVYVCSISDSDDRVHMYRGYMQYMCS